MTVPTEVDIDGCGKRKLSRYMPFFRFAFLLQHGLYVPNVASFTDSWEGLLGARLRQRLPPNSRDPYCVDDYQAALQWIHVSCWYDGAHENFLMWKAYGASQEAVMVESSVARLERLYRDSDELHVAYLSEMKYCPPNDEPISIRLPSLIAPWGAPRPATHPGRPDLVDLMPQLFVKYSHYDGEKEYRLVCLNKRHIDSNASPSRGLLLALSEPQRLIERVRVSPFAPQIVYETVSLLVERLAPGILVERSQIEVNA